MGIFVAAVAAVVAATVVWSSAEAEDVQIHGFKFGCSRDGEVLKPKFGDVDGIYFTNLNLPAEQKLCLETIDRMVHSCTSNTTFISHDLNSRYRGCLKIFEQQANWCARHFERQRKKCYAGDSSTRAGITTEPEVQRARLTMWAAKRSNIRSGPGTDHAKMGLLEIGDEVRVTGEIGDWLKIEAPGGGEAFVWAPLLTEEAPKQLRLTEQKTEERLERTSPPEPFGPDWLVAENQPCQLWNGGSMSGDTVTWSGSCVDGKASGEGQAVWRSAFGDDDYEGSMRAGKVHGYGIHDFVGNRYEGEFRDGVRWGEGSLVWADGDRYEGGWRNDTMHGQGTLTEADGHRYEGGFRDGEKHGRGTYTTVYGGESETYETCDGSWSTYDCPSAGTGPLQGSITFSQEADGGYAWGIAWSFDSRSGALAESMDQCRAYGGRNCNEVGWFREACGALAIGDGNGYGAGWGDTTAEAERDSLSQCRAANSNCRIEVARCSQSQEAGGKGRRPREETFAAGTPSEDEAPSPVLEPKCDDNQDFAYGYGDWDCWRELSDNPGCYFWTGGALRLFSQNALRPVTQSWSGSCSAGVLDGQGTMVTSGLSIGYGDRVELEASGSFLHGKAHGDWQILDVFYDEYGDLVHRGVYSYFEGKPHGDVRFCVSRGNAEEECFVERYIHGKKIDD